MTTTRYLAAEIEEDLAEKMVFLSGPRQVGKTTMASALARNQPPMLSKNRPDLKQWLGLDLRT